MSDPSPDTPNVCPTCRSTQPAARHTGRWWRLTDGTVDDSRHGPCPDEWHACPAARSSPPDYTALAEQLRAVKHYESEDCWYSCPESEEGCCDDSRTGCDCHAPTMWAAADALEAQATRITELERWKAEALVVLGQWDEVWEALGRPGPLGSSKAVEALTEAHRLRATDPPADVHPRHPRQETT